MIDTKPSSTRTSINVLPQGGPRSLAALRIATAVGVLWTAAGLRRFVLPPSDLWFPPPGTAWLTFLPVSQTFLDWSVVIVVVGAVLLALGWRPRWTASITAAAFFYAGWVTTLTGKVDHMHHLLWVLAILAVSPCANAWAIRTERRPGSYSWPVFAVQILIGLIYLGAGLPKLTSAGFAWGWSDNLTNTMLNMAWERNLSVREWLVDWPILGRLMGVTGLIFELSFLPLILHPRTRRLWPVGLLFHVGVWITLGISFLSLSLLYVVFIPWDDSPHSPDLTNVQRRVIAGLVASVAVVSFVGLGTAWPIASYPAFAGITDHYWTDLQVDGRSVTHSERAHEVRPQRLTALIYRALDAGHHRELAAWLGAEKLSRITVNTRTGEILDRELLYQQR